MTRLMNAAGTGAARHAFQLPTVDNRNFDSHARAEEAEACAGMPIVRELPPGCLPFTVRGRDAEPILHDGDVVAVDVMDLAPEEGAFYLRRCNSAFREDNLTILALRLLKMKGNPQGTWWLGPQQKSGRIDWCDGPYSEERLRENLIGRVVAIIDAEAPEAMEPDPQFPVRRQAQFSARKQWVGIKL